MKSVSKVAQNALGGGASGPPWQALLRRLTGIRSVGFASDAEGHIQQIRLLVDDSREPRHLVREVVSLLKVWTGQFIAPEAIEVIQLFDLEKRSRARIVGYQEIPTGPLVKIEVELATGDLTVKGTAVGPSISHLRPRIAAEAAVDAMNRRLASPGLCSVGAADVIQLGPQPAVVVLAYLQGQPYAGSALVQEDQPGEAAVKAALSALNRQIVWPQQQR